MAEKEQEELKEGLVSIVIPVYNRESTLRRCLDSVLAQTWKEIEILVIDDGSSDGSPEVIREYAEKDDRIRPFFREHAGVSNARNYGITQAGGEFLQFADADDWLTDNCTGTFVKAMREGKCEMAVSDYYRVVGQKVFEREADLKESGFYDRQEFAETMMTAPANFYYGVMWNKFFLTAIVHEKGLLCNPDLDWCEDFQFNLEYLCSVKKIAVIRQPLYYYVKTKGSLVGTNVSSLRTVYQTKKTLLEYYQDLYKNYDLYEEHRLRINMFLVAVAHDRGKPFPVEELPEEQVRSELEDEKGWRLIKHKKEEN